MKIMQEVITLSVFVPFAVYYMHQPIKLDYLWAGCCLMGAVFSSSAPSARVTRQLLLGHPLAGAGSAREQSNNNSAKPFAARGRWCRKKRMFNGQRVA